jgi:F-type H+/Na+-transporting ATPase subunit alpha
MEAIKANEINEIIRSQIENFDASMTVDEVGTVIKVGDGIAEIHGLEKVMAGELLEFPFDVRGLALNLEEDKVGAVLFGDFQKIKEGDEAKRTGRIMSVPVGDALIGRVVDALGNPIDGKGEIITDTYNPVERIAPGIIDRQPVKEPLQTGIKAIDSMVPIGRGQRELIIGDRQTGKTAVAIDTILHLRRHRAKGFDGGAGSSETGRIRRDGLHDYRQRSGFRPGGDAVSCSVFGRGNGRIFPR